MSHYETLGVPKDADPVAIKKAYRKKASKAHPDKGGKAADMQKLNAALAVLEDPERRAHYDETGDDELPGSISEEAKRCLLEIMKAAVQAPHGRVMETAWAKLHDLRASVLKQQMQASASVANLTGRRNRIKHTGEGENIAHMIIDQAIRQANEAIGAMDRAMQVFEAVGLMLKAYSVDEQKPLMSQIDIVNARVPAWFASTATG